MCKSCLDAQLDELEEQKKMNEFHESYVSHSARAVSDVATAMQYIGRVRFAKTLADAKVEAKGAIEFLSKAIKIMEDEVINK